MKSKPATMAYAIRSFVGYLEGTGKSAHTIRNYRCDLVAFQHYLEKGMGSEAVALADMTLEDLRRYQEYLGAQGFKSNTRRRKILTVRKLLKYLSARKKIAVDAGGKIPAPHKIERIPQVLDLSRLLERIRALPIQTPHQARNRVMLWALAESGCQVSELVALKRGDFRGEQLSVGEKTPRLVPVSRDLVEAAHALPETEKGHLFLGFNKFGPLKLPITARGVEILVKSYASLLEADELTPRTFRHSAVLHWFREGVSQAEIQRRLGLRTAYAFRVYNPLFRANGLDPARQPHPAAE